MASFLEVERGNLFPGLDVGMAVALGAINSAKPVHINAFNDSVGTSPETVSDIGGLMTYLDSAEAMTISSESADDTDAGSGARTVRVRGLDGRWREVEETVTLNGQTAVSLQHNYIRLHQLRVMTSGSSNLAANAGSIWVGTGTVTAGVPAVKHIGALAGTNRSFHGAHTVPIGHKLFVKQLICSSQKGSSTTALVQLLYREKDQAMAVVDQFHISQQGGVSNWWLDLPSGAGSQADLEIRAIASSNNTDINVGIEAYQYAAY